MRKVTTLCLVALAALGLAATASAGNADVRFATFNASLNRNFEGQLIADLSTPANAQAATVAEIIQRDGSGPGASYRPSPQPVVPSGSSPRGKRR